MGLLALWTQSSQTFPRKELPRSTRQKNRTLCPSKRLISLGGGASDLLRHPSLAFSRKIQISSSVTCVAPPDDAPQWHFCSRLSRRIYSSSSNPVVECKSPTRADPWLVRYDKMRVLWMTLNLWLLTGPTLDAGAFEARNLSTDWTRRCCFCLKRPLRRSV